MHDGVAVTLPFTAAGGGYVGAGDLVNVFVVEANVAGGPATLVLEAAAVLDVSAEVAPRVASGTGERGSTAQITYLLSVPSAKAPAVITAAQTKTVYLTLLPDDRVVDSKQTVAAK